jgi:DNA-binding CsgD family transcriptional regulator
MNISVKTVANHRQNMLDKCGCRSTVGLLKLAVKNRWIDFE